jgi:hypothetical protein
VLRFCAIASLFVVVVAGCPTPDFYRTFDKPCTLGVGCAWPQQCLQVPAADKPAGRRCEIPCKVAADCPQDVTESFAYGGDCVLGCASGQPEDLGDGTSGPVTNPAGFCELAECSD